MLDCKPNFDNLHKTASFDNFCNGSVTAGAGSVLTFFANTDSKKMQD